MQRINDREVILTDAEMMAVDLFDELLDLGGDIPSVLGFCRAVPWLSAVSDEFWEYLVMSVNTTNQPRRTNHAANQQR